MIFLVLTENRNVLYLVVFYVVTPRSLLVVTNDSEERFASIFRVRTT